MKAVGWTTWERYLSSAKVQTRTGAASICLKPWMNPGEVFRATAKRDAKFIEWNAVDGKDQKEAARNPGCP